MFVWIYVTLEIEVQYRYCQRFGPWKIEMKSGFCNIIKEKEPRIKLQDAK